MFGNAERQIKIDSIVLIILVSFTTRVTNLMVSKNGKQNDFYIYFFYANETMQLRHIKNKSTKYQLYEWVDSSDAL